MKKFMAVLSLLFFVGCATSGLQVMTDEVNGTTYYDGPATGLGDFGGPFSIGLRKVVPESGSPRYLWIVYYHSGNWFFIEPGASLTMRVDGKKVSFSGDGSLEHRTVQSEWVRETAYYQTTLKKIKSVLAAEKVVIRVDGGNAFFQATLTKENKAVLKKTLALFAETE